MDIKKDNQDTIPSTIEITSEHQKNLSALRRNISLIVFGLLGCALSYATSAVIFVANDIKIMERQMAMALNDMRNASPTVPMVSPIITNNTACIQETPKVISSLKDVPVFKAQVGQDDLLDRILTASQDEPINMIKKEPVRRMITTADELLYSFPL